ncbi:RNA polymerase sigma factor [Bariatricus sp. HCP28S3_A7]|uniref:RNA polymerase sigma factor n=1 Tax=Bariatricus sp. HCP28S3_A7 TaxID=3438894 RepID=UPI003F892156
MSEIQRGVSVDTQDKDTRKFEEIYIKYKEVVYKTALRYSDYNREISQEMTQEVFVKLCDYPNLLQEEYIGAWLVTSVKNATINCIKKGKYEILSEDGGFIAETANSTQKSPEDAFLEEFTRDQRNKKAKRILDDLYETNERWYDAVTKSYCLNMPQKEVAEEMGVSIEVLHSVLYRAREWVKKRYKSDED